MQKHYVQHTKPYIHNHRQTMFINGRKFIRLDTLKYPVYHGRSSQVVFPAGEKNVWVSYGTGPEYTVPETGNTIKLNVYYKNGITAHTGFNTTTNR